MNTRNEISESLREHYQNCFSRYGESSQGVDWGDKEWAAEVRQDQMLKVIIPSQQEQTLLDVGCGYGALADRIKDQKLSIHYHGIDIVEDMTTAAKSRHPNHQFFCGDIFDIDVGEYDYLVCNGILTQKLSASTLAMNQYAQSLIKRMFTIAKKGIAFNLMSTFVNFQKDNLYYRNPADMLAWCMAELTPHVRLDHAYALWYEYTVYLYKI